MYNLNINIHIYSVIYNIGYNMRVRVPGGIPKDQIFVVLILGLATGIYNWRNLLVEHIKEHEKEQLNEVIKRITPKH